MRLNVRRDVGLIALTGYLSSHNEHNGVIFRLIVRKFHKIYEATLGLFITPAARLVKSACSSGPVNMRQQEDKETT